MTPQFVFYVIPIAALLSVLVTFGLLSRNSELTVMKACGISLYRASLSVILLSLVFSVTIFQLEQRVLASANRKAEIIDAKIRGRTPRVFDALNRQWVLGRDGAIYHYSYFNPETEGAGDAAHLPARARCVAAAHGDRRADGDLQRRLGGPQGPDRRLLLRRRRAGRRSPNDRSCSSPRTTSRPSSRSPR